jgi:hypothetical protein
MCSAVVVLYRTVLYCTVISDREKVRGQSEARVKNEGPWRMAMACDASHSSGIASDPKAHVHTILRSLSGFPYACGLFLVSHHLASDQ